MDDDDEDRPRRKKKRKKKKRGNPLAVLAMFGPSMFVGLGRGNLKTCGIVGVFITCILGLFALREISFAVRASAQPEEITLKALISRGEQGNPYLLVTQFELGNNAAYQKGAHGIWTSVWVPIVPAEDAKFDGRGMLKPPVVEAMFYSMKIRDEQEIETRLRQPKVQVFRNNFTSLSTEVRRLLEGSYPGTDLSHCLILEEGRTPAGWLLVFALAVGTGIVLLATIVLFTAAVMAGRDD